MSTIQDHLKRYPNARPSTLVHLEKREEMTERLKKEVEAEKPRPPIVNLRELVHRIRRMTGKA